MKKIKNIIYTLTIIILLASLAAFVSCGAEADSKNDSGKPVIVATLFPQYDFAKQIAGDKAIVKMLLPPGVESHSYEPSPADIISINKCDVFVYTGEFMEMWAENIISGIDKNKTVVADTSKDIEILNNDPHIWTSPVNASKMAKTIADAICEADPANKDYYQANLETYQKELSELDASIKETVTNGIRKKIVFGERFAFMYFCNEYGLEYASPYSSCSEETEPSASEIASVIDLIRSEKIPVIYYEQLESTKVAESLSDETEAEMLLMHTCHNVSTEDFKNGVTYLDLMKQNLDNLIKGLN